MTLRTLVQILKLGRLKFPLNGLLLYSIGTLLAIISVSEFILSKLLMGYAIYFTTILSVSYSNDYFDINVDKNYGPTPISGGSGILIPKPELREFSKWFAIFLIALSIILAVLFISLFSYPMTFLISVILGNSLGWFYTAPPLRLSYRGLSEITAIVTLGLITLWMSYFTLKATIDGLFLTFAFPSTFYVLAFILSVEIPDLEEDKLGEKTL